MKLTIYLLLILFVSSCETQESLVTNERWKLENVYFTKENYWGDIKPCNQYIINFSKNGNYDLNFEGCDLAFHSDHKIEKNEEKWRCKDDDLYISAFGKCKILYLNKELLIIKMDEGNKREGNYYFSSNS
jgi:hypothetical protein